METNYYLNKLCYVIAKGDEELLSKAEEYAAKVTQTPDKPKRKVNKFTPPTVEEVAAYCEERGNGIDAVSFIAHYEANGWTQGKNHAPIKNWKACITTWEKARGFNVAESKRKEQLLLGYQ